MDGIENGKEEKEDEGDGKERRSEVDFIKKVIEVLLVKVVIIVDDVVKFFIVRDLKRGKARLSEIRVVLAIKEVKVIVRDIRDLVV